MLRYEMIEQVGLLHLDCSPEAVCVCATTHTSTNMLQTGSKVQLLVAHASKNLSSVFTPLSLFTVIYIMCYQCNQSERLVWNSDVRSDRTHRFLQPDAVEMIRRRKSRQEM